MSGESSGSNRFEEEMRNVWNHIKRPFLPIRSSVPNIQELTKLEGQNEALQNYAVWRRSSLFLAAPSVVLSMILGLVNYGIGLSHPGSDNLNGWCKFIMFMAEFSDFFLLGALLGAAFLFPQIRRSTQVLQIGWIVSLVSAFLPAIFPLEMLLANDVVIVDQAAFLQGKVALALTYAISLLPIVITLPGSAIRACLKVRNLFPNSSLPGWILMLTSPFYSLVVLIALVMVVQIWGNGLLLSGTLLLVIKPLGNVIWGRFFLEPNSEEVDRKIKILLLSSLGAGMLGLLLIAIWILTADVGLDVGTVVRLLFETIGRILVTTVVFCDFVVGMVLRDWEMAQKKKDVLVQEDYVDIEAFLQALKVQSTPKERTKAKDQDQKDPEAANEAKVNVENSPASASEKKAQARSRKTITEMPDGTVKVKEETTHADGSMTVTETITENV
mmetsp:Transcript_15747/g.23856  ORF Transcript_15747/g.23856 Transcript_15747/m.23856 type:complete len:442 (+) Transcript_15747:56-1381(+)